MENEQSAMTQNITDFTPVPTFEQESAAFHANSFSPFAGNYSVRAINGYDKMSLADFQVQLNNVVQNMEGNRYFPMLQQQVIVLKTEEETFKRLAAFAEDGGKTAILKRDESRFKVTELLKQLGADVTAICRNNVEMFASSGLKYTGEKKTTPPLVQPDPPKVKRGTPNGVIAVSTRRQLGISSIIFMIAEHPEGEWKQFAGSRASIKWENLTRGKMYYIKVQFAGVRNQRVESDYISVVAP